MNRLLTILVLILAAAFANAEDFIERPVDAFPKGWKVVQQKDATALETATQDGALAVIGMKGADTAKNGVSIWSVERGFSPVAGDFAASVRFDWDLKDAAFMGEFMFEIVGGGKVLASAGFRDVWIAQQGGMQACLGESPQRPDLVAGLRIPLQGKEGVISVERNGNSYRFLWNGKSVKAVSAPAAPVEGIRLSFRFLRYAGNATLPQSHYGTFVFREVSFKALKSSDAAFTDKPQKSFDPLWQMSATGAKGLAFHEENGALVVDGFAEEDDAKIAETEAILERKVLSCKGDFTAVLSMDYDLFDNEFMGIAVLQVLDDMGNVIAEGGLNDSWIAYPGRVAAGTSNVARENITNQWLPLKASVAFNVERRGKMITVRIRDWKFFDKEGSEAVVSAVRLIFRRGRYKGSHFGKFVVHEVSFRPGAEPLVPPAVSANAKSWQLQEPIIWYWAGPDMSDEFAAELKAGGWNTAFGKNMFDLDVMQRHGLRGILWMPCNPDTPENIALLKSWLESVRHHPAMYGVSCGDEPGGERMLKAQERVNFMIENAPELLHFNNMYPYGASNKQLGHEGTPTQAYDAHIKEYFERLKPQLLSYDHYTFFKGGDRGTYFNNQAIIRKAALANGIPSMNIVQGCAWTIQTRVPTPFEYRWLAYTSLAYGSQGLSCYVYGYKGHRGSMRDPVTGKTGELYEAAKSINREFYAIAKELRPLTSLHAYHTGEIPYGVETLDDSCVFQIEPRLKNVSQGLTEPLEAKVDGNNIFNLRPPITGWVLGVFGKNGKASHVLLVNLDYKNNAQTTLVGPKPLERFNPLEGTWKAIGGDKAKLDVPPGSGVLLRIAQ